MPELEHGQSVTGGDLLTDGLKSRTVSTETYLGPRFSLRTVFVITSALAALLSIGVWTIRTARFDKQERAIRTSLKYINFGIQGHDFARRSLPSATYLGPKGESLSSWRFQIIPWIGFNEAENRFYRMAWNAPANNWIARSWAAPWYCLAPTSNDTTTNFFAIVGLGTAFDRSQVSRLDDIPNHTIVVMEIADSKTHWMQPGDYDVTTLLAANGNLGDHVKSILPHRIHVLFADGDVWTLSDDTPMSAVKPFLTIAGAESADREELLAPHRVN